MAATPGKVMSQTRRKETNMRLRLNPSEASEPACGGTRVRCAPDSPQEVNNLIPYAAKDYSAKELKYLCDDVGRGRETPPARPAPSEHICRGRGRHPDRLAYLWPGPVMLRPSGGYPDACRRFNRHLALAEIPSPSKALRPGGIRQRAARTAPVMVTTSILSDVPDNKPRCA